MLTLDKVSNDSILQNLVGGNLTHLLLDQTNLNGYQNKSVAEWIIRKQKQLKSSVPEIKKPIFEEDSSLPYLGKNYPLRINKNQSDNIFSFIDDEFMVDITNHMIDHNVKFQIKQLYEDWIIRMAYPILKTKVNTYSHILGVDIPEILIKSNLKSRWESLTRKGSINFNMHLVKAPEDVIDYIVLHELCHLKVEGIITRI
jgi:predicted metal-dependent hydrolase